MQDMKEKAKRVQIVLKQGQKDYLDQESANEGLSLSALLRRIVEEHRTRQMEQQLEMAASALASEYESNQELTSFAALDAEDFS